MKISFIALMLLSVLSMSSCGTSTTEKEENQKFVVTSPAKMDTIIKKEYVCQIQSIRHIELRALEIGYLQRIYVDEGQFVKQGQLLFQIMPNLYQAEMQKAKADAQYAEIEYQNTKRLADGNVVSRNELAMAKAKYDREKAELDLRKVHLQFTEIRAPFDGIVDRFRVRLGSLVEEGDLLTNLSDNSKMWVYYNVPEAEYLDFKSSENPKDNTKVELIMANGEKFAYGGVVETIEADFNNETGNIPFRATFPNPKALLRHGETGNIEMDAVFKKAIIIPQKSTFEVLEKKYVFVVDKQNVIHQREITVSAELPDIYIIGKGLKPDEKILLEGIRKVENLQKIRYSYVHPKQVISHLNVYVE